MQRGSESRGTLPVHAQIASVLQEEIRSKHHARGEKLPSEAQLCERFHVNRYTIRLALDRLIQSGLVRAHHGKGHFVNIQPLVINYPLSPVMRFSEAVRQNGCKPSSKLLSVLYGTTSELVAQQLGIDPATMTYRLDILRMADGIPVSLNETWIPAQRVPNLEHHLEPFDSLYSVLEKRYDITLQREFSTFESTYPTPQMMNQLNVTPNTTILRIESVTRDQNGERVEYTAAHYRGDLCRVSVSY